MSNTLLSANAIAGWMTELLGRKCWAVVEPAGAELTLAITTEIGGKLRQMSGEIPMRALAMTIYAFEERYLASDLAVFRDMIVTNEQPGNGQTGPVQ